MITRISKALAARREAITEGDKGFTLIELLVVVIIIGILAAIAIPVYIGVQNSAQDSAAQSNLTNAKNAVVAWYTDPANATGTIDLEGLSDYGYAYSATDVHNVTGTVTSLQTFCLQAQGHDATHLFHVDQNSAPTAGGCTS